MKMRIFYLFLFGGAVATVIPRAFNDTAIPCPGTQKPLCNHGTYRIRPVSYIGRKLYQLEPNTADHYVASLCGKQNYRQFSATVSINLPKNVDWSTNGGAPNALVAYDNAFTRPVCYISATDVAHQRRCSFTYPGVAEMPYIWIKVSSADIAGTIYSLAIYFDQSGEMASPQVHPDNPEWRERDIAHHQKVMAAVATPDENYYSTAPACPPKGSPPGTVCLEQIVEAGNGVYENQNVCNEKIDCYVVDICKNSDFGNNWEVNASISGLRSAAGFQSWMCDPTSVFNTSDIMGCGPVAGAKIWDDDTRASAYNFLQASSTNPKIGQRLDTFVVAVEGFGGNADQSNRYELGLALNNLPG